ncbi:hypothetical protein [Falsiroseomonas sp. E2-1-a4]|uniref:hypothetical protein n=1 Tax=Falsiroseomonas sp. E2-1-a4 TaxID=3239299 RepID=UPI003F39409C
MVGRTHNASYARLGTQHIELDLAKLLLPTEKKAGFPTTAEAVDERDERVRLLSSSVIPAARKLAAKLTCDDGEEPPASLADPCYTRLFQRVTASQLLGRTNQALAAGMEVKAFTLVWPEHAEKADALLGLKPKRRTEWLRRVILKHLPPNASGWIYVQLHGEYEAKSNTFIIHFHGIAAGDYLAALDGPVREELRDLLKALLDVQSNTLPTNPTAPKVRVVLKVSKLVDPPRQVSYVLQSWWPARPIVWTDRGWKRVRAKGRIPEPHHSTYLVWLDRQSISGMRLRMGLGSGG